MRGIILSLTGLIERRPILKAGHDADASLWHHEAMSHDLLPALVIDPVGDPTHVFLWLHGLGDSGAGHEQVVRLLPLPDHVSARFILPHAPNRPVTVNMGAILPAWYDIKAIGGRDHDIPGIRAAADQVSLFIDQQVDAGIPADRIFVAGFSQGGCVALHIALRYPEALAGVIGLSTYIADIESLADEAAESNADLPAFLGHGVRDPMVPFAALSQAKDTLERLGHDVTCGTYPMEHSICPEELEDLGVWLRDLM